MITTAPNGAQHDIRPPRPSLIPASGARRDAETQTSFDLAASSPPGSCEIAGEIRRSPPGQQVRTDGEAVVHEIYRLLVQRLPGRIHDLRVESLLGHAVALSGVARSYYVKQLAQHIAMEVARRQRVINRIEVRPPR